MGASPAMQGAPSLARKTLVALSLLMVAHVAFGYALLMLLIAPAFNSMESSVAKENLSRINGMLQAETQNLTKTATDWGHWHDMYRFAMGDYSEFEEDHMDDDLLQRLGISWFLVLDLEGNILVNRGGTDALLKATRTQDLLHKEKHKSVSGFLEINGKTYIFSSLPVLDGDGLGTPAGSLTLARQLDQSFVDINQRRFAVEFDIIETPSSTTLDSCPSNYHCDQSLLYDIYGSPIAALVTYTSRDLFTLGRDGLNIVLALLAVAGLLYVVLTWVLLRKLVLKRLGHLATHIRAIAESGDLTQRLISQEQDEIGRVAHDLNTMTDNLERADKRVRYLAFHDVVTGLPNRRKLDETIFHALSSDSDTQYLTMLYIDLDRFKFVNDTLSHAIGDKLLVSASTRLKQCVQSQDFNENGFIARVGGDEFIIVFFQNLSISQSCRVARAVIETLEQPFFIEEEKLHISGSIGISSYPKDSDNAEGLIKQADIAMYRAKESGGGSYHVYNSALDAAYHERVQLDRELTLALERNQFRLFYQPLLDFEAGRIIGCEALIRWHHPNFGLIPPSEFIPMAEENGTITDIGRWAILEACRQIREWKDANLGELKVAVNVSPKQFRKGDLVEDVRYALDLHDLPGHCLGIELTESSVMQHPDEVVKVLKRLKVLGLSISMDDFGTGYSSLSHLRKLPIDIIKIDRSFVVDMVSNGEDRALVSTIIAMGHSLNRHVIAEGVESIYQVMLLRNEGCHTMQGYFFGKPVPPEQFVQYLSQPVP
ncbi:MAG: EAL domain-containing protein, partial [Pseudomonadota bacterium]